MFTEAFTGRMKKKKKMISEFKLILGDLPPWQVFYDTPLHPED